MTALLLLTSKDTALLREALGHLNAGSGRVLLTMRENGGDIYFLAQRKPEVFQ